METDLVIAGLSRKRDEIDAGIKQVELRLLGLRTDRSVIEAAVRVFDPAKAPVRRVVARQPNGISRVILGILRTPGAPLSVRQIAERIEAENGPQPDRELLVHNVRNTVARHNGKGLRREVREGVIVWSV
jgi:hypothetical protein